MIAFEVKFPTSAPLTEEEKQHIALMISDAVKEKVYWGALDRIKNVYKTHIIVQELERS